MGDPGERHAHLARATFAPGNRTPELEQKDANLLDTLQRLHKSEGGQAGWILLTDAFAGALAFLPSAASCFGPAWRDPDFWRRD